MIRADVVGGAILTAGFTAALYEALSFQFGSEFAPGPGFAPVWLSSIGIAISLLLLISGLQKARRVAATDDPERSETSVEKGGFARVVATLVALGAMIAVAPWIGFVPAMLAFLLIFTLLVQRLSLPAGLGTSLGTVLFVYTVFVHFLKVPVPAGPLGF